MLAADVDYRTATFVSDRAGQLEEYASEQVRLEADIRRLREYLELLQRHQQQRQDRESLENQRDALATQISSRELGQKAAEDNVRALEHRMLEYLRELNIPDLGPELSLRINRTTYLPEISGRSFDELSSQGLKNARQHRARPCPPRGCDRPEPADAWLADP